MSRGMETLFYVINKTKLVHSFTYYMYIYQSLHVSGDYTGYAGFIPPCIQDSHSHRIACTKCRINTVVSPDDGLIVARNM